MCTCIMGLGFRLDLGYAALAITESHCTAGHALAACTVTKDAWNAWLVLMGQFSHVNMASASQWWIARLVPIQACVCLVS